MQTAISFQRIFARGSGIFTASAVMKVLIISVFISLLVISRVSDAFSAPSRATPEIYWGLFIKGVYQGNMPSQTKDADFVTTPEGNTCLDLKVPGSSEVGFTFTLDEQPKEFYAVLDMFPLASILRIEVNGTLFRDIPFGEGFVEFFSEGMEISQLLKQGENRVTIKLASPTSDNASKELKLQSVVFTRDPTILGSSQKLPDLIPPYAKIFAIVLLILTVLYIIWSFLNRSLYQNLDVYSASFALIGIMIMAIATAYSILLVKTKIVVTIVFLVMVIILTVIAMISAKGSVEKDINTVDSGSPESGDSSGGDKGNKSFEF